MDRHLFGHDWLPAQIQTVNPVFVLIMLPLFSYVIYPFAARFVKVTPLRRFGGGLWAIVVAFLIVGWIQTRIDAGEHPTILWQILAFVVLTAGEVMLSVTHLEFSYTQAPQENEVAGDVHVSGFHLPRKCLHRRQWISSFKIPTAA